MVKRNKASRAKKCLLWTLIIVIICVCFFGIWIYKAAYSTFDGTQNVTVVIPKNSTEYAIGDSLKNRLGEYGLTVFRLWSLRNGDPEKAFGVYSISPGDKAWSVASRIKSGRSSTIKITFNNNRTMSDLAQKIANYFPWTEQDFMLACNSILPKNGFKVPEFPAAFIPDTYEFYASADPTEVVSKLLDERNRFWNDSRRDVASSLNLTPVQVATLASIVEEESNNMAERPIIARLYMNRLNQNMKLQADPTVKFAVGDFTLRRVLDKHTSIKSDYNTYYVHGLPPGPIRVPERSTLESVLNAPENDYLFMCAKPGYKGTHNFSTDYSDHLRNARIYQAWLDSIGIK